MFDWPTSSPQMTRMLGFWSCASAPGGSGPPSRHDPVERAPRPVEPVPLGLGTEAVAHALHLGDHPRHLLIVEHRRLAERQRLHVDAATASRPRSRARAPSPSSAERDLPVLAQKAGRPPLKRLGAPRPTAPACRRSRSRRSGSSCRPRRPPCSGRPGSAGGGRRASWRRPNGSGAPRPHRGGSSGCRGGSAIPRRGGARS
jgi:hypothetical protein